MADDKLKSVDWTTVESLKTSSLAELVADLKEADQAVKDAEARKDSIRALIAETLEAAKVGAQPLICNERRVAWVPPSKTYRLDRALLVKAGVTPKQLEKGTAEGEKKGYLDIKVVKGE